MNRSSSSYAGLRDADRGGAAAPSAHRTSRMLPLALVAFFVLALSALLASNSWSPSKDGVSDESSDECLGRTPCPFPWSNEMILWQRTGFHFQPESNWMNDPNAPMFYKGWYHLFYQYNPESPLWGNLTWGHAISRDLLHWFHLPLALLPDQWYDSTGVWSGSATLLPDGRIFVIYTGVTNMSTEVQNLATPADPSDPLLLHWIKSDSNPIILAPPGILPTDFRDPTTAWFNPSDSTWRFVIGSKDSDHAGIAIVYTTLDFVNYKLISGHLHRVASTGIWECIDMYPIATGSTEGLDSSVAAGEGVKHVLKASTQDDMNDYYAIGTYEASMNEWRPDQEEMDVGIGLRYDWGNYYASKTFYDVSRRRRVLLGWIRETDSARTDILKGWASLQAIPRTVVFDVKTGSNLLQWPVEEVKSLRMTSKDFSSIALDSGSVFHLDVQCGTQFDVEAEFEIEATTLAGHIKSDAGYDCSTSKGAADRGAIGPFGLLILTNQDLSEQTATYFYVNRGVDGRLRTHFCQDETRSSKATDIIKRVVGSTVPVLDGENLSLRILVDHSIVESFAQGGRSCITSRVYPTNAISNAARIYLFNNATSASVTAKSLKIWEMNSTFIQPYPFKF